MQNKHLAYLTISDLAILYLKSWIIFYCLIILTCFFNQFQKRVGLNAHLFIYLFFAWSGTRKLPTNKSSEDISILSSSFYPLPPGNNLFNPNLKFKKIRFCPLQANHSFANVSFLKSILFQKRGSYFEIIDRRFYLCIFKLQLL